MLFQAIPPFVAAKIANFCIATTSSWMQSQYHIHLPPLDPVVFQKAQEVHAEICLLLLDWKCFLVNDEYDNQNFLKIFSWLNFEILGDERTHKYNKKLSTDVRF